MAISPDDEQELRRALKRCSDETIEAALHFRETRDRADVKTVVLGILGREMDEEKVPVLAQADSETRLIEDLGLDSLALTEVVMSAEDVFEITIENSELATIRTFGDLEHFVETKLGAQGKS